MVALCPRRAGGLEQRLTAELAHELRTPLAAMQGTVDLMLLRDGSRLSPEFRADLAELAAASRRLGVTITTLLDLARSRGAEPGPSSSSLVAVVDEAVAPYAEAAVDLRVRVADLVLAVPAALAVRALAPVVENAVRYAATTVDVTARRSEGGVDGGVEIVVADDGPGVAVAVRDSLFEPAASSGEGTGLGLAIARRLARFAGGDVAVVPGGPSGAVFVVRLPEASSV